jgi:acylphosphatase
MVVDSQQQEKVGMQYFISGHVQGVFYRAATQDQAALLGLTGWARNLPDGRVEVVAFGEKAYLMELYLWLKKGPAEATVSEVHYQKIHYQQHDRFAVK